MKVTYKVQLINLQQFRDLMIIFVFRVKFIFFLKTAGKKKKIIVHSKAHKVYKKSYIYSLIPK